ncbi:hypothetical protein E1301_Tti018057 [Triplophysa tibetana]|uniref:Uncharacterized protein n=1 Tax=Triplophysa tibetana TaxID=1572043 RepID=A0A5A9NHW4_9TELE|nr:hypothetical protein E1301_Tti018057 [Triplophysa tibetana]
MVFPYLHSCLDDLACSACFPSDLCFRVCLCSTLQSAHPLPSGPMLHDFSATFIRRLWIAHVHTSVFVTDISIRKKTHGKKIPEIYLVLEDLFDIGSLDPDQEKQTSPFQDSKRNHSKQHLTYNEFFFEFREFGDFLEFDVNDDYISCKCYVNTTVH